VGRQADEGDVEGADAGQAFEFTVEGGGIVGLGGEGQEVPLRRAQPQIGPASEGGVQGRAVLRLRRQRENEAEDDGSGRRHGSAACADRR